MLLSYAQRIGLLGNVVVGASAAAAPVAATPVAPCSLSSSLDGQSNCKIPNINDPFHLIITDNTRSQTIMEFGLEYGYFTLPGIQEC